MPDVVLHQALYLATLSNQEARICLIPMTLHHLSGDLQKHKFVHSPADDLQAAIASRHDGQSMEESVKLPARKGSMLEHLSCIAIFTLGVRMAILVLHFRAERQAYMYMFNTHLHITPARYAGTVHT